MSRPHIIRILAGLAVAGTAGYLVVTGTPGEGAGLGLLGFLGLLGLLGSRRGSPAPRP